MEFDRSKVIKIIGDTTKFYLFLEGEPILGFFYFDGKPQRVNVF